ncbi:MAG: hypothetical protein WKF79_01875 [Nocardioides sp.]
MSADEQTVTDDERKPDWWHRDHPTFTALTGFFGGLAFVIVVPGAFAGILSAVFDYETAEELFPFVLLTLVVPIGLMVAPRTRRFGKYLLFGMVTTAIVVIGVAALVLFILIQIDG